MNTASRASALALGALVAALYLAAAAESAAGENKDNKPAGGEVFKVQGKLTAKDHKDTVRENSPSKSFKVKLHAGKTYAIDMKTQEPGLDPYLRLEDAKGKELAHDDDSGGFPNARIVFHCEHDGTYKVIATTFQGGTGKFLLTVHELVAAAAIDFPLKDGSGTVEGRLDKDDPKDSKRHKSHAKVYAVKLQAGKTYQIDLQSKAFDSFLRLENASGKQLAEDDDSGGNLNARIVFNCEHDGTYHIIATTLFPATGEYTLSVQQK